MTKKDIEKIKIISYDENWEFVKDNPEHYYCRFRKEGWTLDVYYSKKGTVRLKKKKGENTYLYFQTPKKVEEIFKSPITYYKGSYVH